MSERSAVHATFVLERRLPATPAKAFAAWSERKAKSAWFTGQVDPGDGYTLDFRLGGQETTRGGPPGGAVYTYEATYQDIVPAERIVYAYVMDKDGQRISASVTTVEFKLDGATTHLILTEQGVFLDGLDEPAVREGGVAAQLDALGAVLRGLASSGR